MKNSLEPNQGSRQTLTRRDTCEDPMLISDVTCRCGAEYERAESASVGRGTKADSYRCETCGSPLERRDPVTLIAYRLVVPPPSAFEAHQAGRPGL